MPLHNLQLVLRPTSLNNHYSFISLQAGQVLTSELFSDLVFLTPDGTAACHLSLLVPLSPLLQSLFSSYTSYSGMVHTVVTSINLKTIKNILTIIYTGKVFVQCRQDMDLVLAGLDVLGISLPGFEFLLASTARGTMNIWTDQALDLSLNRDKKVKVEVMHNNNSLVSNNSIPLLFSTPAPPKPSTSLLSSIVKLPNPLIDVKPQLIPDAFPSPPLSLLDLQTQLASQLLPLAIDESVQCNVVGCSSQVSLRVLETHFKCHVGELEQPFQCDVCNMDLQNKKALEIHRTENHNSENEEIVKNAITDEVTNTDGKVVPCHDFKIRKRRRVQSIVEESLLEDIEKVSHQSGNPLLKTQLACELCHAVLASEWYRPPGRHKCPHATPRKVLTSSSPSKLHCPLCNTDVATSWHKPPSRHACPAVSGSDKKKMARTANSNKHKTQNDIDFGIKSDSGQAAPEKHQCPLSDCSRQCSSRKKLLVHLAMKHYLEELEQRFGTGCEASQCPECSLVVPGNKFGFIKHMVLEHEKVIMTFVKRDCSLENTLDDALDSVSNIKLSEEELVQSSAEQKMGNNILG